jgi:hypothetical protein
MKNNKLIAEFMDIEFNKGTFYDMGYDVFSDGNLYRIHELKYHESWDWLMPVVEKIYSLDADIDFFGSINFEATYKEVLEFIKEYNDKQQ